MSAYMFFLNVGAFNAIFIYKLSHLFILVFDVGTFSPP